MDQKRTLWITIAAGVFLLVVVGAALILYSPAAKKETQVAYNDSSDVWVSPTLPSVPADSFSQGTASTQGDSQALQNQSTLPTNGQSSTTVPADESTTQGNSSAQPNGITQTDNLTVIANGTTNVIGLGNTATPNTTTIDLNTLKTPNTNVTANNQAAQNAIDEATVTHEQTVVKEKYEEPAKKASTASTSAKTTAKSASTSSAKKVEKTTTPKKAAVAKIPDQFWIQILSSSVKKNADEARTTLDSKKLPAEVFTYKDSKETLYYRVRVGPYTTKSEAEYWQSKIEEIEMFAKSGSYITNSSAPKK
ncbi:MAG: SPOR domain-containing protein [Treponema sp.]